MTDDCKSYATLACGGNSEERNNVLYLYVNNINRLPKYVKSELIKFN